MLPPVLTEAATAALLAPAAPPPVHAEAAAAAVLAIAALPPVLAEVAAAAVLVYVLVGWVFGDYVKTRDAARPDML